MSKFFKVYFTLLFYITSNCSSFIIENVQRPFKTPITPKNISKLRIPEETKEPNFDLSVLDSDNLPEFEMLKIFPQTIEKRIYEILVTHDGKYVIFINRWSLSKISLETLKEVKFLNHRQLVQGGFTGIGVSEDGEKIIAGSSWTHKASLYNWNGENLRNFYCGSSGFFVYDARISIKENQVLLLCYDFANNKREVRSFDLEANLKWKKEVQALYLQDFQEIDKLILYEDKLFSTWTRLGNIENFFLLPSKIVSLGYAKEPNLVLLGNSKEWSILRFGEKKQALVNVKIEKDLFTGEDYKLNEEFKSFYKISRSGKFLLSGGRLGAYLWTPKGELKQHLRGHLRNVTSVGLSPDESLAITASPDKWIVWKRVN